MAHASCLRPFSRKTLTASPWRSKQPHSRPTACVPHRPSPVCPVDVPLCAARMWTGRPSAPWPRPDRSGGSAAIGGWSCGWLGAAGAREACGAGRRRRRRQQYQRQGRLRADRAARRRRAWPLSLAPSIPGHCSGQGRGRGPSAAPRGLADLAGKHRRGVRRSQRRRRRQRQARADQGVVEPQDASSAVAAGQSFNGGGLRGDFYATGGGCGGRGVP